MSRGVSYRAQVFCDRCTSQRIRLPEFDYMKEERVCEQCFKRYQGRQRTMPPPSKPPTPPPDPADDDFDIEPF